MFRILVVSVVIISVSGLSLVTQERQEKETQKKDDKIVIPSDFQESVSRRDFMRTKLMFCQRIFEGLTTGNFKMIDSGIQEVKRVTEGEMWVSIDDDRYRKLTEDFKTAVVRLETAAATKNIDAIALRYYQMSTSCIDCHSHIRVAQYEF